MTKRVKWVVAGVCAALVLAGGMILLVCHLRAQRFAAEAQAAAEARAKAEARAAAERKALYAQFNIDAPGTRLFVPLSKPGYYPLRAEIGKALFNDPRLTGLPTTQTIVCGRCHHLGAGGTDSKVHHGVLTRPVCNVVFGTVYFHDGSASNLHAAVAKMIDDPHFSGHPKFSGGRQLARVVALLEKDASLVEKFKGAYGDGLTGTNVVDAVAEFLKTRVTEGTPYDFWCAGHADSFTPEQQRGSEVFLNARCMDCHGVPALGGRMVSNGRKVPALRGLGLRKAYLTEGKIKDLDVVVPMMSGGAALAPQDRKSLVEFLKAL